MAKIDLPENHKRSISSSLYLVEQLADEIRDALNGEGKKVMSSLKRDESEKDKSEILDTLTLISEKLKILDEKYILNKQNLVQSRVITSRKTKMWEVLSNTKPKHLKGFGEFPEELRSEFEADLEDLLNLVEKL